VAHQFKYTSIPVDDHAQDKITMTQKKYFFSLLILDSQFHKRMSIHRDSFRDKYSKKILPY